MHPFSLPKFINISLVRTLKMNFEIEVPLKIEIWILESHGLEGIWSFTGSLFLLFSIEN